MTGLDLAEQVNLYFLQKKFYNIDYRTITGTLAILVLLSLTFAATECVERTFLSWEKRTNISYNVRLMDPSRQVEKAMSLT